MKTIKKSTKRDSAAVYTNGKSTYDIIHFEALGPEAAHLEEEIASARIEGRLPRNHKYLITPANVQDYLENDHDAVLPEIISIKTHSILPDNYFTVGKKSIITRSAGYDHVEHLAEKANVTSLREYCINAVAQTALKFIYAAAGELNHYTQNTVTFERGNSHAFMELGKHKIVTVFGVGKIGKRIYELCKANGLTVRGVDLREDELKKLYGSSVKFISKNDAIGSSDILVNAMNLTRDKTRDFYNVGYFSEEYLKKSDRSFLFINVTRGEIAPESVLLKLYKAGRISGIGLDVFSDEVHFAKVLRAKENGRSDQKAAKRLVEMSINRTANIYVQPHQGFNSDIAAKKKAEEAIKHVASWCRNNGGRFDDQLPYF